MLCWLQIYSKLIQLFFFSRFLSLYGASPGTQMVKNLPAVQKIQIWSLIYRYQGFPCGSAGKESTCHEGDLGSIPGLGRSPGEGNTHSSILAWRIPWTV